MFRFVAVVVALASLLVTTPSAAPAPDHQGRLYLMPLWSSFLYGSEAQAQAELNRLRARFEEGGPVKLGFSVYIYIQMDRWPVTSEAEAVQGLSTTIARLDQLIARARSLNVPVGVNFVTYIRSLRDPAQTQTEAEDRRVMQWYDNNSMAGGWWTLSRYAREQYAGRELYLRALGRIVANRMAQYPDTLVAAAGDGEVEHAFRTDLTVAPTPATLDYADYSPFAVAEFRDWLRGEGLYAPGQPFAAHAYANARFYRGDPSPGVDGSGEGRTLNGDFGTSFTSWSLRYFDWSLQDPLTGANSRQIPASEYTQPGWVSMPPGNQTGFDPPRTKGNPETPWWRVWFTFREAQVKQYNHDFARWMTTSPDPTTGLTVPWSRWFSYQIPADYLFEHTPQNPDIRYLSSASSWSTADIRPWGGAGLTSFNTRVGGTYFRTLPTLAPLASSLLTQWALLEWNPSLPATTDPQAYRDDARLVEQYRPTLLVPYAWNDVNYPVLDVGFETAVREMIPRIRSAPWALSAETSGTGVRLTWATPDQGTAVTSYVIEVGSRPGASNLLTVNTGSPSTVFRGAGMPGTYYVRVRARRGGNLSIASNEVRVQLATAPPPPPAPVDLTAVVTGTTITFNWVAPVPADGLSGYRLEAGSAPGQADLANLTLGGATTYVVNNAPPGTYHVRVRAIGLGGASAPTNDVIVSPGAGATHCTPVSVPPMVHFAQSGRQVSFEWNESATGAAPVGYVLEAFSAANGQPVASVPLGPARGFAVSAPPGAYRIRLRSVGTCGVSEPGPEVQLNVP